MKTATQTCESTRADGEPCGAVPRPGRSFCAFHDPECHTERNAGRRRGGLERSRARAVLPDSAPPTILHTTRDVCELLAQTIDDVRTGRLDPKIANTVGYLAGVMVRALQVGELEDRLAALESATAGQSVAVGSSFHRALSGDEDTGEGE